MRPIAVRFAVLLGLAACLAVPGLSAVGNAAPRADGRLVITGARTSYVDIVLKRPTTEPIGAQGFQYSDFETRGSYAAYVLRPLNGTGPWAGGHILAKWSFGDSPMGFQDMSDWGALKAGRYRLYLITDGPTTFRVTLPGYGDTIHGKPSKPFAASFGYRELGPTVSLGMDQLTDRQTFHRSRRTHAIVGFYNRNTLPATKDETDQCLTARGASCSDPAAYGGPGGGEGLRISGGPGWRQSLLMAGYRVHPTGLLGDIDVVTDIRITGEATRISVFRVSAELP